jgi:hypothetical protein
MNPESEVAKSDATKKVATSLESQDTVTLFLL